MKTIIIIFGLLYAVHCKPADIDPNDYLDDGLNDNENYDDGEDEDVIAANEEQEGSIISEEQLFVRNVTETVELPCVLSGDYIRIWRKNEILLFQSLIRMGATEKFEVFKNGTLKITNLSAEDDGQYMCSAMMYNDKAKNPKITHTLRIRVPPQIESLTVKDNITVLRSGDTLSLTCQAKGFPEPVISWHKGGERLAIEGKDLVMYNVKHHNSGEYTCFADNKIGDPAIKPIIIKVEFKPTVTIDQISVSSAHNLETELKCTVNAEPPATVIWQKDGLNVKNDQHTELSSRKKAHFLIIKNLQESDFGVYTCSATNSLGSTSKNVTIVKTPAILRFLKPKPENRELVLTWEVQSKLPILEHKVQYRKKGESDWHDVTPESSNPSNNDELYTVKFTPNGLEPGIYETRIQSKNHNGWSEYSEIKHFERVHAKHGHHKSHKKPHRDRKEKQIVSTQEVVRPTEPSIESAENQEVVATKNPQVGGKPSQNKDKSAENQEVVTTKNPQVGAAETSGCSSLTSAVTFINVALVVIFLVRSPTMRI